MIVYNDPGIYIYSQSSQQFYTSEFDLQRVV